MSNKPTRKDPERLLLFGLPVIKDGKEVLVTDNFFDEDCKHPSKAHIWIDLETGEEI